MKSILQLFFAFNSALYASNQDVDWREEFKKQVEDFAGTYRGIHPLQGEIEVTLSECGFLKHQATGTGIEVENLSWNEFVRYIRTVNDGIDRYKMNGQLHEEKTLELISWTGERLAFTLNPFESRPASQKAYLMSLGTSGVLPALVYHAIENHQDGSVTQHQIPLYSIPQLKRKHLKNHLKRLELEGRGDVPSLLQKGKPGAWEDICADAFGANER